MDQEMVKEVVKGMAQAMLDLADSEWQAFFDEEDFVIDHEPILAFAFTKIAPDVDVLPTNLHDAMFEHILEQHLILFKATYAEMRDNVWEKAIDHAEWSKAQQSIYSKLRYHGMSVHDFI